MATDLIFAFYPTARKTAAARPLIPCQADDCHILSRSTSRLLPIAKIAELVRQSRSLNDASIQDVQDRWAADCRPPPLLPELHSALNPKGPVDKISVAHIFVSRIRLA